MPETNDEKTTASKPTAKPPAARAAKPPAARAAKPPADDGDGGDGEQGSTEPTKKGRTPRTPKMPTGKFVAKMNLEVLNPQSKMDAEGKWIAGRHTVKEGEVVPDFVSKDELAKFQDMGVIDHQFV